MVSSKLGLSTVRTPHPDYPRTPGHSAARKGPNTRGPFNLVSFNNDVKIRPSSQESSFEAGKDVDGDKTMRRMQINENDSMEELNSRNFDREIEYPPRAYTKSESIGGVGRYVHK